MALNTALAFRSPTTRMAESEVHPLTSSRPHPTSCSELALAQLAALAITRLAALVVDRLASLAVARLAALAVARLAALALGSLAPGQPPCQPGPGQGIGTLTHLHTRPRLMPYSPLQTSSSKPNTRDDQDTS